VVAVAVETLRRSRSTLGAPLFVSAILLKIAKAERARVFYCAAAVCGKVCLPTLAGVVEIAPSHTAAGSSPISGGPRSNARALVAKEKHITHKPHSNAFCAFFTI